MYTLYHYETSCLNGEFWQTKFSIDFQIVMSFKNENEFVLMRIYYYFSYILHKF